MEPEVDDVGGLWATHYRTALTTDAHDRLHSDRSIRRGGRRGRARRLFARNAGRPGRGPARHLARLGVAKLAGGGVVENRNYGWVDMPPSRPLPPEMQAQ